MSLQSPDLNLVDSIIVCMAKSGKQSISLSELIKIRNDSAKILEVVNFV